MLKVNLLDYCYRFGHGVLQVKQMLVQKLERYLEEIRQRKKLDETRKTVERLRRELLERRKEMPMGKGTYGSQRGRPAKKKMGAGLTAKAKDIA